MCLGVAAEGETEGLKQWSEEGPFDEVTVAGEFVCGVCEESALAGAETGGSQSVFLEGGDDALYERKDQPHVKPPDDLGIVPVEEQATPELGIGTMSFAQEHKGADKQEIVLKNSCNVAGIRALVFGHAGIPDR